MLPRILTLTTALLFTALPAAAQDRAGRDTPGEWIITHHKAFGQWDSMCDERSVPDSPPEQRCYLRYVDVFSPRPDFAAQFIFITPDGVQVGTERGTRFENGGIRIENSRETHWSTDRPGCLRGRECQFAGDAAIQLIAAMKTGDAFRFVFTDRHGVAHDLTWDLAPFSAAHSDYLAESALRPHISVKN